MCNKVNHYVLIFICVMTLIQKIKNFISLLIPDSVSIPVIIDFKTTVNN